MDLGVIADIHGNKSALDAVLGELDALGVETVVCAGDICGVLGSSNAVIDTLRERAIPTVYGNHDTRFFESRAWLPQSDVEVAEYNHVLDTLSAENLAWLRALPEQWHSDDGRVSLAHARPETGRSEGGLMYDDAGIRPRDVPHAAAKYIGDSDRLLIVGHTHYQHAVDVGKFDGMRGLLLNPGSVGYPYDSDYAPTTDDRSECLCGTASYAVVDTETHAYDLSTVRYESWDVFEHLRTQGLVTRGDLGAGGRRHGQGSMTGHERL
jgi:predicted phosphodiesterase